MMAAPARVERAVAVNHLTYRPDIDGIRALAVLAVIGFHAAPRWVPGGFVGVDVFFVISGFLITSIIVDGLDQGAFSLVDFYSRRVRRIFPALLVVLVFCFALGWLALLANEFKQLGKHIAGAAGFVSNFVLWSESGYFDNAAATKPLVHLWSLGVEEQFYIVWPPLLYLLWKRRYSYLPVIIAIFAISFGLNVSAMRSNAVADFFSPATRFWELMVGGVFACLTARGMATHASAIRHGVSILGGMLILLAVLGLSGTRAFPGFWALLPTAGAVMLISAGRDAWLNRAVFSCRALVWIGLISYPLYLWHWVLQSYATIISTDHTVPKTIRIALIILSVALAAATYALVERPIRYGKRRRTTTVALAGLMVCVGVVGAGTNWRDGIPSRIAANAGDTSRSDTWFTIDKPGITDCSSIVRPYTYSSYCYSTVAPNVALIGDSHAGHLYHGFLHSADDRFSRAMLIEAGSCWPTLDAEVRQDCNKQLVIALETIGRTPTIEYVVLGGYYLPLATPGNPLQPKFFEGYLKTFSALRAMGKRIVFVIDSPTLQSDPVACLRGRPIQTRFPQFFPKAEFCDGARGDELRSHAEYDTFVSALRKAAVDVVFYDPARLLCANGTCRVFESQHLLYWDWNHLSTFGSEYVVTDLVSHLR